VVDEAQDSKPPAKILERPHMNKHCLERTDVEGYTVQTDILVGDALERLRELPDESVDCCVTSPPYFNLRDYGTGKWEGGDPSCDHFKAKIKGRCEFPFQPKFKQKASAGFSRYKNDCPCGARRVDQQIGLEPTIPEYIGKLVVVFREVRRVLRPDGTLWVNIGDSYAGNSKGAGGKGSDQRTNVDSLIDATPKQPEIRAKNLCGAPWELALGLRKDGWVLRQELIWIKTNPVPYSVTDRCTTSHEPIYLLSKSLEYYFDQEAIREGAHNKRTVWETPIHPFPGAHLVTFPPELITACIIAGCPKGGTVLDPFFGAGTTGLIANRLQRNAIGIELNQAYVEIARKRIRRSAPTYIDKKVA